MAPMAMTKSALLASWAVVAAATPGLGASVAAEVRPHDHVDGRLMRKEASAIASALQRDHTTPTGYVNRGQDCPGTVHTYGQFNPLFLQNVGAADCATKCNGLSGCVGFTYNRLQSACYFKAVSCENMTNNGWEFFQKASNCDYSKQACQDAVTKSRGVYRMAEQFEVSGGFSGCLTYSSGPQINVVFYGTYNGREPRVKEELPKILPQPLARVEGFGCPEEGTTAPTDGSVLQTAVQGASLLEQDQEPELVLEDELDRVASLSEEALKAEALQNGVAWPLRAQRRPAAPEVVELGSGDFGAGSLDQLEEADEPAALLEDPVEDEEDRQRMRSQ